jgi:uncharacterized protein (TIGR02271 family)
MNASPVVVVDQTGERGLMTVSPDRGKADPQALVELAQGAQLLIPAEFLVEQADGTYRVPLRFDELLAGASVDDASDESAASGDDVVRIPVTEERLHVGKRLVQGERLQIHKIVHEMQEQVDVPLLSEEVEIRRVPVNRTVDAPLDVRYEGDTMVIPLLEEVVTVQKQLLLREEIHITKKRTETHQTEAVTLRREEVVVEPVPVAPAEDASNS